MWVRKQPRHVKWGVAMAMAGGCIAAIWAALLPAAADPVLARTVKRFGAWSAHIYEFDGRKVCFISARARKLTPKGLQRQTVRAYVSNWAAGKIQKARTGEVSLRMGIPLKPGNSVSISIDGKRYALFSKGDMAFVAKPAREKQLVKALGKGRKMIVNARTRTGPNIRDTYSLNGSGDALKYLRTACQAKKG